MMPILLSIPHGGTMIPDSVRGAFALSEYEWRMEDSDAYTREIYDLDGAVAAVVAGEVARAVVDLNRAPDDRPPANPDGVVKSHTCYGRPVWRNAAAPDAATADALVAAWYVPFHDRLTALLAASEAQTRYRLALDCHSMAAEPPPISPDADSGQPRPLLCLGNAHGATCPPAVVERLAGCLREAWELERDAVAFNRPFAGGYIVRHYGRRGPVPWVLVEISRALYLAPPWFDAARLTIDGQRLAWLRSRFHEALADFVGSLDS